MPGAVGGVPSGAPSLIRSARWTTDIGDLGAVLRSGPQPESPIRRRVVAAQNRLALPDGACTVSEIDVHDGAGRDQRRLLEPEQCGAGFRIRSLPRG